MTSDNIDHYESLQPRNQFIDMMTLNHTSQLHQLPQTAHILHYGVSRDVSSDLQQTNTLNPPSRPPADPVLGRNWTRVGLIRCTDHAVVVCMERHLITRQSRGPIYLRQIHSCLYVYSIVSRTSPTMPRDP